MSVTRSPYDDQGLRWAECDSCGMGWVEDEEDGERGHVCPEPFSLSTAESLLEFYAHSGTPISQETKARIRLGLNQ